MSLSIISPAFLVALSIADIRAPCSDAPFSNNAFREANQIKYPLLSDVHREVISAYGVTFDNFAIDGYTVAQRSVFLVEADGTIGYAWYADNPGIEPDYSALFAHISGGN